MPSADSISATRTTTRLLDALRDHRDDPAWAAIDARYRPVIAGLARRIGLSESDAAEVAQQTLSEFVRAYQEGRYNRAKGRLSSWILGIAHHTALQLLRRERRGEGRVSGDIADAEMAEAPSEPALRSIWTDERDRAILSRAMSILRDESSIDDRTLMAFELVALRGVPAPEVADQCGMTVDQVYVAKSRVTKRLRETVDVLTAAFEEDC